MRAYYFTGRESDEDFYLIPTKLNKSIFMDSLEEIIGTIAEGDFVSYRMTNAFSLMFLHFTDALKIYCDDHADDDKGKDICLAVIDRLKSLETDDDVFPDNEIDLLISIVSNTVDLRDAMK